MAAVLDQIAIGHAKQVFTVQQNLTRRGIHKARQTADDGGFPGPGKPHDHKNFAHMNVKRHIGTGRNVSIFPDGIDMILWVADHALSLGEELFGLSAIDLPDIAAGHFHISLHQS